MREQLRAVCFQGRPARDSADQPHTCHAVVPGLAWGGKRGKSGAGKSPQGDTTPVRTVRSCDMDPVKSSALNPVLSQNARPVFALFPSSPARPVVPTMPTPSLPVCPLAGNSGLASLRRPGAESGSGPYLLRPLHRWRRFGNGFSHPLLGLDQPAAAGRGRGFGLLHQLNAVLYAPAGAAWAPCSASAVAKLPLAELVAALVSLALGLLILRSPAARPAPRRHPLRAGVMGSVAVHAMAGMAMKQWGATAGGWVLSVA